MLEHMLSREWLEENMVPLVLLMGLALYYGRHYFRFAGEIVVNPVIASIIIMLATNLYIINNFMNTPRKMGPTEYLNTILKTQRVLYIVSLVVILPMVAGCMLYVYKTGMNINLSVFLWMITLIISSVRLIQSLVIIVTNYVKASVSSQSPTANQQMTSIYQTLVSKTESGSTLDAMVHMWKLPFLISLVGIFVSTINNNTITLNSAFGFVKSETQKRWPGVVSAP
jgi:hypothetical protein